MKKILVIFYLIFCGQFGFSQFEIDWVNAIPEDLLLFDVLELQDESMLLNMSGTIYSENLEISYGDQDIYISRIDKNGKLIWLQNYGSSDYDDFISLNMATDGNIILVGASTGSDFDVKSTKESAKAWIFKIDLDGKLLWSNVFTSKDSENRGVNISPYLDGKNMIYGEKLYYDNADLFHIKKWWLDFDENSGQFLDTIYDPRIYKYEHIRDAIKKVDDGFLLETRTDSIFDAYNDERSFRLLKLDNDLNPIFFKIFKTDDKNRGLDMNVDNIILWNDKYYLIGQNYLWSQILSGELEIICMEKDGEVLWRKTFENTYFPDIIEPFIIDNQLVVVIASASNNLFGPNIIKKTYGNNSRDIIILGLDEDGKNIWQQNFGGTESETIYGVTKTLDNGLIINGVTESSDIDFEGMNEDNEYIDFVMKLFPFKSTLEKDNCIDFTIVPNPIEEDEINIHFDVIFDRMADIVVTDVLGRVILSQENYNIHDNEYLITLPNGTPKGVYFVALRCGKDVVSQKVIKLSKP